MRIAIFALLFVSIGIAGCQEQEDHRFGPLKQRVFSLQGQQFSIELPERVETKACMFSKNGVSFDFKPGGRSPMVIVITAMPSKKDVPKPSDKERSQITTHKPTVVKGGSGGPEVTLNGELTFSRQSFVFSCDYQSEFASSSGAFWCVKYLETLRFAPPSSRPHDAPPPAKADTASRC
jgi:hypothetical protein